MHHPETENRYDKKPFRPIPALTVLLFILLCCLFVYQVTPKPSALDGILKTGKITVITRNNANCYYLYRDQPMGFEYDLAKAFAEDLGVGLNLKIAESWDEMISMLMNEAGAFIAAGTTMTPTRKSQVAFSDGHMPIQQHIITHRNNPGIKSAEDLAGKTVHVRRGTSYQEKLESLKRDGIDLIIKLHDDIPTEELIRRVATKHIEITIADSNIALLNRRYYPQTILAGTISDKEYVCWLVRPETKKLLEQMNLFFKKIDANGMFAKIYDRYYAGIDNFDYVDLRTYHRRLKTKLPRYRTIIENVSSKHNFDWRLIAAQIYQESHFNPKAKSHGGAYGLMQLTRSTARSLGVKDIFNPEQNIKAGVRHLKDLYDFFDQAVDPDRKFIALAAYNVGQGHIWDARNLAKKMDLDPNSWESLSKTLPLLRYRKYYKEAKYGYCRGTEPIEYLKKIMIYYDILKHQGIRYHQNTSSQQ